MFCNIKGFIGNWNYNLDHNCRPQKQSFRLYGVHNLINKMIAQRRSREAHPGTWPGFDGGCRLLRGVKGWVSVESRVGGERSGRAFSVVYSIP